LVVATSNFTQALDAAFLSRADVTIEVPLPDAIGATAILRAVLMGMAVAFPRLGELASDPALGDVAASLAGIDGRRIRKVVTEAMLRRIDTVTDPGALTLADLLGAARCVSQVPRTGRSHSKEKQ
jgi:SpoVK/Ycf46/Vps4 family AAA+-type ATPase